MVKNGEIGSKIMFFGEFRYKIDQKGRLPIPPKFREELKHGVILTEGPEKCILAYALPDWEKLAATLIPSSAMPNSKSRRLNRAIFATAFNVDVDAQGRIALPASLREYAEIKEDVIIAGANNYIEIWNKDQWDKEKSASREEAWGIIESLERH